MKVALTVECLNVKLSFHLKDVTKTMCDAKSNERTKKIPTYQANPQNNFFVTIDVLKFLLANWLKATFHIYFSEQFKGSFENIYLYSFRSGLILFYLLIT